MNYTIRYDCPSLFSLHVTFTLFYCSHVLYYIRNLRIILCCAINFNYYYTIISYSSHVQARVSWMKMVLGHSHERKKRKLKEIQYFCWIISKYLSLRFLWLLHIGNENILSDLIHIFLKQTYASRKWILAPVEMEYFLEI